jgi:N utilization substance protein B
MNSRRRCRETALRALYQCDTLGDLSESGVESFFTHFSSVADGEEGEEVTVAPSEFAQAIARGVVKDLANVDTQIGLAATHWSISRMSRVDRNILRIAVFELLHLTDVPVKVAINEAIEIAKSYAGDESPNFINGVLDKVASSSDIPERIGKEVVAVGEH